MSAAADIVAAAIRRAALVGWRVGARRQIIIQPDGTACAVIGYCNDTGWAPVGLGDDPEIDCDGLPEGVSITAWTAPPDDVISLPAISEDDVRAINTVFGGGPIDKGRRSDGAMIYHLRGAGQ